MDSTTTAPAAESSSTPRILSVAPSNKGRTPGKAHKSQKTAKARSYISPAIKTPYEKRREADLKKAAVKGVEKDMKEEEEATRER
jgi:rRNA-processing protein CGR1